MAKLSIGDLVSSSIAPAALYRVTSKPARDVLRLLPYQRSGGEVLIMRIGSRWVDGSHEWTKVTMPKAKREILKAKRGDRFVTLAWNEPGRGGEASYPESVVPELLRAIAARGITSIWADPVARVLPLLPAGMTVEALY